MNKEYMCKKDNELLKYLIEDIHLKRNVAKKLLSEKLIEVNGENISQFDYPLKTNDKLVILHEKINTMNSNDIKVIYEDDDFIVVDKPAGLLSISSEKVKDNTTYHYVREYIKSKDKHDYLFVVHRLDKDTSGVLVFSKSERLKKALQDNWNKLVKERKYYAIVNGKLPFNSKRIENYLLVKKDITKVVDKNTKGAEKAITDVKLVKSNNSCSLLDVDLSTGKKNQIRATLNYLGHPILGDSKYGKIKSPISRLCLHAYKISFVHPFNHKVYTFESRIPSKFKSII